MRAIQIQEDKSLVWADYATPEVAPESVLIKVHATAINRADLVQRQGFYPPPPGASEIMGLECAGEILAVGEGVTRWQVGDRVCALMAGGGYAEIALVHETNVLPIPEGLDFAEAACLPEVFATAWLNLFMEAGLKPGEKVVLHAGASGVGTAGIQLCKAFSNEVFVTVGSEDKLKACLALGATAGSNRHEGGFLEKAQAFAGASGVDVILDPVGGAYLADNTKLLGVGGRLVLIGLMGGSKAEMDLGQMMMKRLRVIGSTLRARPIAQKAAILSELEQMVWPKISDGDIKPILDKVFPIAEADAAHQLVASDQTIGKVILSVEG